MKSHLFRTARLAGFRQAAPAARRTQLVDAGWLAPDDACLLARGAEFDDASADAMIENVVGVFGLPLGVALNFVVDAEPRLVPMAVEEASIVAAASYAARMVAAGGGFVVEADPPLVAAQVELLDVADVAAATRRLLAARDALLRAADDLMPRMAGRGGGARELEVRTLDATTLCVHLHVDCRDAMGANLVNTIAEGIAPALGELAGGTVGLRILTNLTDRRKVTVRARVPVAALASERLPDGAAVRDAILAAQRFADRDPYRATTHNKGIMNGVDPVLVACGNDWRAVEAGAHAWACRDGRYRPLSAWTAAADGALDGVLTMPLATATVGGAARSHPGVRLALRLAGVRSAVDLAGLAAAAGLACNLAALRALSTEGIQHGHMRLHVRRVAAEAGASGAQVDRVAAELAAGRVFSPAHARDLLAAAGEDMTS